MAIFGGTGNPHHDKLPRDGRHIIRRMLRVRGYHRASVLGAEVRALDYAVNRRESPNLPLPDREDALTGQRVRIGADARGLLKRLLASRNLRVQQQLVREINHAVIRRIRQHAARSRALRKIRERSRRAAQAAGRGASRVKDYLGNQAQRNWNGRKRTTTTVGAKRTRATAGTRSRALPSGDSAARARTPATRGRTRAPK